MNVNSNVLEMATIASTVGPPDLEKINAVMASHGLVRVYESTIQFEKVWGKTVSVALSREQYEWLRAAIANWREVQTTLKEMQRLSREVLFTTAPHPPRRKRLGKKVLGLI